MVIAIFVEYGFDLSATREAARERDSPRRLGELISGVLGAKGVLSILCLGGALFARRFTYHIAPSEALFWSSTIWGICQGINMLWFFQGLEQMRLASALEIGGKVIATFSIFVLVRRPEDGWKVMAAQCVGCIVAHGVTVVLAYRQVGFVWPTVPSVVKALRMGWTMFLFRAAQGLTNSVNGLVLGAVAPLAALGEYAGAEKITRVFQQGLWPINQALYPRLTRQMQKNPNSAMKTVRSSILFLTGLGLLFGGLLFVATPLLVRLVLGPAFHDSIATLRVFAFWIPLVALGTVLTFQLVLPNRLDRQFNFVVISQGLVNIGVAFVLGTRFAAVGIAWSAVIAQLYSVIAFMFILSRANLNPFARGRQPRHRGIVVPLPAHASVEEEEELGLRVG
jgi:polysaccharide transporter, PST family